MDRCNHKILKSGREREKGESWEEIMMIAAESETCSAADFENGGREL